MFSSSSYGQQHFEVKGTDWQFAVEDQLVFYELACSWVVTLVQDHDDNWC